MGECQQKNLSAKNITPEMFALSQMVKAHITA
jgi:hypothetical protein